MKLSVTNGDKGQEEVMVLKVQFIDMEKTKRTAEQV
jgi:hypothetical protein